MLMWLKVSGIEKGPLFPKIRGKEILIAHKRKMFSLELKTIEQWVTVTECLVHMSYEDYSSITNHLFQRVIYIQSIVALYHTSTHILTYC